eukprot:TRINITY_DN66552_c0_g1_i1.p1 TRINITY_DN66552_c0_g1~~TRINITY_DN66552_c0_g1_i1.p1  ORF type:complete len:121 (+),score=30.52 TRINITY_DN66552_c0_g1_i1:108-470(+)
MPEAEDSLSVTQSASRGILRRASSPGPDPGDALGASGRRKSARWDEGNLMKVEKEVEEIHKAEEAAPAAEAPDSLQRSGHNHHEEFLEKVHEMDHKEGEQFKELLKKGPPPDEDPASPRA